MGTIMAGHLDASHHSHAIWWTRVARVSGDVAEQPSHWRAPCGATWPPLQGAGGRCHPVAQPPQCLSQLWEPWVLHLTGPPCVPQSQTGAMYWQQLLHPT